jgi:hypothetical protein
LRFAKTDINDTQALQQAMSLNGGCQFIDGDFLIHAPGIERGGL